MPGGLPEPSVGWVVRVTNLNVDSRCKESPELAPGHPNALRVRGLGRLEFELSRAKVVKRKPRGGPPTYGHPVHVRPRQLVVELGGDERCD